MRFTEMVEQDRINSEKAKKFDQLKDIKKQQSLIQSVEQDAKTKAVQDVDRLVNEKLQEKGFFSSLGDGLANMFGASAPSNAVKQAGAREQQNLENMKMERFNNILNNSSFPLDETEMSNIRTLLDSDKNYTDQEILEMSLNRN